MEYKANRVGHTEDTNREVIMDNNQAERIEDINKAEQMAYAEKTYRDEIARSKEGINIDRDGSDDEETGESLLRIAELNERANAKAEEAGDKYDIEKKKLEIAHKLKNNGTLTDEELAFLESVKEKERQKSKLDNQMTYEEKVLHAAGVTDYYDQRLFIKERKKLEKQIGVLSDDEIQLEIKLRKAGEWNDTIGPKILKYRDAAEKERALTDENHPYHEDMVRIYGKLVEGQSAVRARMKKELVDTQHALRKLEETGISDLSLDYYNEEVDRICGTMAAYESRARDEAYQIAKLNAMIDEKLKETSPLNTIAKPDYQ